MKKYISLLALSALYTFAQSPEATITGFVRDSQGASVPGVTVEAVNEALNARTQTTTNEEGFYSLQRLRIGTYRLSFQKQGFRTAVREGVTGHVLFRR